jgi:hypothetical protein
MIRPKDSTSINTVMKMKIRAALRLPEVWRVAFTGKPVDRKAAV